jgi:uncharacterized protein (TIGR02145 family)
MNCSKCKAEWTPPVGRTITQCPFCGEALVVTAFASKEAALHEMLHSIVQQFGREILGETRLRGLISDLMPNTEKKYLRILKQAVDDRVGTKLLEMDSDTFAVRTMKISSLKDTFKNNNAFNHTADYVVDCFLFALGWFEGTPMEKLNHVSVDSMEILNQQIDLAFSDGKLTKDEALLVFQFAESLHIPETTVSELLVKKIKRLNFYPSLAIDKSQKNHKTIICATDWQHKAYESVRIGNQVWMKRNLDVCHFRNGDPIPEAKTDEEWKKAGEEGKPAWCFYDNNPENGKIYGKLYNWFAVKDSRGLAPKGWHVPIEDDWTELIDYIEGDEIEGIKLKSKTGWNDQGNGTDEFKFSAFPGGCRNTDGAFYFIGYYGYFWSSTQDSATNAWYRNLDYNKTNVYRNNLTKSYGFSVRCLRGITLDDIPTLV